MTTNPVGSHRSRRIARTKTALRFLVLLGIVAGCGPASEALTVPATTTPVAAVEPRTYVWTTRSEGDSPVTHVLSEDGTEIATLPGVRIAAAGTLWTWDETTEGVATAPCDGDPERPAGEGHGTRVRLVPADGWHEPITLVAPPSSEREDDDADSDGIVFPNEVEHSARPLASVGRYLFVEESTYADFCGAHGSTAVSFEAWDIEGGHTVDLLSELPDPGGVLAAGKSAIDDDPDTTADFSDDDAPATLTEMWPRIGPRGRLEATALVTVPSCYACTQGGWSSYTVSTQVPATLPPRLQGLSEVPHAVSVFADRHPELTLGGYSVESR